MSEAGSKRLVVVQSFFRAVLVFLSTNFVVIFSVTNNFYISAPGDPTSTPKISPNILTYQHTHTGAYFALFMIY